MIVEDYVSFEIAKLLKKKGFKCTTLHYYYDEDGNLLFSAWSVDAGKSEFIAPTLQMAMKWLREKYDIHIYVENYGTLGWIFILHRLNTGNKIRSNELYNTYEEACEAAIKFYLENLI